MMRLTGLFFTSLLIYTSAAAQENSPYSRYGLGDMIPNQNITARGMGGISAGVSDFQTVNFVNPASYGNLGYYGRSTIFDFGAEVDTRILKSISPLATYSATNLIVSYMQLGMPVKLKKANKKGVYLGIDFGLRPVSRVNYKIFTNKRLPGVDSLTAIDEGTGGVSEAMFGAGLRIKKLNIGFNSGYRFGNKSFGEKISFLNDSVSYYQSNSQTKANFGGMFFTMGAQYEIKFKKSGLLRLGAFTSLSQKMSGTQDLVRETVSYTSDGEQFRVDSVYQVKQAGNVQYPSSWGAGFTYQDSLYKWTFGADFEQTNWGSYRFFDQTDKVQNTWKIRAGAEYLPAGAGAIKKFASAIKYRAGFYYGPNYVNTGVNMPEFAFTFGAGFPLKLRNSYYETQRSYLNAAVEIGSRGNKNSNLRESFLRVSVGFSLSDWWFNRSKYY